MSKLITLGCSFSEGVGCYDIELFNQYGDIHNDEFQKRNNPNFLEGSIGRNLQKKFGFRDYHNYAHGGSSNKTQFLKFFQNLPDGDDITVLWQITFYTRKGGVHKNVLRDWYIATDTWVREYYDEATRLFDYRTPGRITTKPYGTFTGVDKDDRLEIGMYIKIMNEFCKSRGWKFFTWFWESNEYKIMEWLYEDISECIIPFNRSPMMGNETYESITEDSHPNELGYLKVSNDLIKTIEVYDIKFPIPNEPIETSKSLDRFINISNQYFN